MGLQIVFLFQFSQFLFRFPFFLLGALFFLGSQEYFDAFRKGFNGQSWVFLFEQVIFTDISTSMQPDVML